MENDDRPVGELKNIGPYMEKVLNKIGILTVGDLFRADYRDLMTRMNENGITPHILMFYSIEMGLQNRKWSDITPAEKKELREVLGL